MKMIFNRLLKRKEKTQKKEERKIEYIVTGDEFNKALIEAMDSAKNEIIIITDTLDNF